MKLQDQVCSLEQAKRLEELGIKGDSLANWVSYDDGIPVVFSRDANWGVMETDPYDYMGKIHFEHAAFTVAELIQMIGAITIEQDSERWYARIPGCGPSAMLLPWALAQVIIYRLENNLTTPAEINARLTNA